MRKSYVTGARLRAPVRQGPVLAPARIIVNPWSSGPDADGGTTGNNHVLMLVQGVPCIVLHRDPLSLVGYFYSPPILWVPVFPFFFNSCLQLYS